MILHVTSHKAEVESAAKRAVWRALQKIGLRATKYAKAIAPVGTPESTGIAGYIGGTLRNSITYETHDNTMYIGTNVEYAPYQELGYQHVSGRFIPATNNGRGYLRPAISDHISEYKSIASHELHNERL